MKRKIISIDKEKCTGCGQCIPDCPEGALQVIEGKACLVGDLFCDGLGACIGTCPEGAISVVEREAEPYDERAVMATILPQGDAVIRAHLEHLAGHGQEDLYREAVTYLKEHGIAVPEHSGPVRRSLPRHGGHLPFGSCPGSASRSIVRKERGARAQPAEAGSSELRQWPVQLALLHPAAPYFDGADLLIAADCVPFAYAGFHAELLEGKILIVFCPKLDADIEGYIEKLAEIFSRHEVRSITVARMEVPCCGGVRYVVDQALERAGKTIPITETTITIEGGIA